VGVVAVELFFANVTEPLPDVARCPPAVAQE